jgi:hypothetical protein
MKILLIVGRLWSGIEYVVGGLSPSVLAGDQIAVFYIRTAGQTGLTNIIYDKIKIRMKFLYQSKNQMANCAVSIWFAHSPCHSD